MGDYWHQLWTCPYFRADKKMVLYCDAGTMIFPDEESAREIMFEYCAVNFEACPFAKMLTGYHERQEKKDHEEKQRLLRESIKLQDQQKSKKKSP